MILYAVIAAVLLAVGFGSGWQTHGWKTDAQELSKVRVAEAQRDAALSYANDVSSKFETKLSKLRITNTTVNQEVRHETEKTVYRDCLVPDSGVVLLNRAIGQANADTAQPDAEVRSPNEAAKPGDDGRSAGVVHSSGSGLRRLFSPPSSAGK